MSSCLPLITVVTPSYNQGQYLEETINSVLTQNYPNLEYIIIDGGSTDQSPCIIKRYSHHLHHWVSEPDAGQAHALNKGFQYANGQILAYINSDDLFLPDALAQVAEDYSAHSNPQQFWFAYAVENFDENGTLGIVRPRIYNSLRRWAANTAYLHQPGVFWSKEIHKKVGGFDENLSYAFDRKFFVTALLRGYRLSANRDFISSRFRYHGNSKTVEVGSIDNLGFAPEFDSISEWLYKSLSIPQRISCVTDSLCPRDIYRSEELFLHSFDRQSFSESLDLLVKAAFFDPSILVKRKYIGALKALLRRQSRSSSELL